MGEDFRGLLGRLERAGLLRRVKREVDPRHFSTLLEQARGPLLFERVKGYDSPAVGNVAGNRRCLTAGLVNIAAARGVHLTQVTSTVEGDIDLLGILGMSDQVRNGYEQIRVSFHIEGDADDETLRGLVEQSRRRSAVYDALTNPTPVVIDVTTG